MQKQLPQHSEIVTNDWVDYNGHMNVAYYVLIFDHATDVLMNHISLDQEHRNATGGSMFVVESHIVYEQEVMEGIFGEYIETDRATKALEAHARYPAAPEDDNDDED